jgi:hypothetical protein
VQRDEHRVDPGERLREFSIDVNLDDVVTRSLERGGDVVPGAQRYLAFEGASTSDDGDARQD